MILADIAHGDADASDALLLAGAVLAVLAGLFAVVPRWTERGYTAVGWLAVGCIAVGLLLL